MLAGDYGEQVRSSPPVTHNHEPDLRRITNSSFPLASLARSSQVFMGANMLLSSIVGCKAVGSVILKVLKVRPLPPPPYLPPPHFLPEPNPQILPKTSGRRSSLSRQPAPAPQYHPLTVDTAPAPATPTPPAAGGKPPRGGGAGEKDKADKADKADKGLPLYVASGHLEFEAALATFLEAPHPSSHGSQLEAAGALSLAYLTRVFSAGNMNGERW
jgi:hypothetical protein